MIGRGAGRVIDGRLGAITGPVGVHLGGGQRGLMASADDGDGSSLRVGPYVSEPALEPLDPAAENAVTQLMPVVQLRMPRPPVAPAEPRTGDIPVVRAVARRPPTALPALGGDEGPRDGPPSTRS